MSEPGYERWDGNGALGYLVLNAVVEAQLAEPPQTSRLVAMGRTFPTGMLGHWTRRLAGGGLIAALTATSPRRLGHPAGGPRLTGTNPLSIAIPSSDRRPVVVDVSMGNHTYGDVLAGRAIEDDLAPFGGDTPTRPSPSPSAYSSSSTRSPRPTASAPSSSSQARSATRFRLSARSRQACAFRAIADCGSASSLTAAAANHGCPRRPDPGESRASVQSKELPGGTS